LVKIDNNHNNYGITNLSFHDDQKKIHVEFEGYGKGIIKENKGGSGVIYYVQKSSMETKTIENICKLAVDNAKPGAIFDLSNTPDKIKEEVHVALKKVFTEKFKNKDEEPKIVGISQKTVNDEHKTVHVKI
jgi:hypothetical protein